MPVTVTTSHAAPFIRLQLIHAAGRAAAADTIRERTAGFRAAHAYGQALEIISNAESTAGEPDGVADLESCPQGYIAEAFRFLGGASGWAEKGMGPVPEWLQEQPSDAPLGSGRHEHLPRIPSA